MASKVQVFHQAPVAAGAQNDTSHREGKTAARCRWLLAGFAAALVLVYAGLGTRQVAGRTLAKVSGVDAVAYFGVSHSMLFDHDFDLTNEYRNLKPVPTEMVAVLPETGRPGNPWAMGYSLLSMPFLAAGTAVDWATGAPPDGYGRYAILGYALTNIVITGLGLIVLFQLLLRVAALHGFGGENVIWLALAVTTAVFFGTNACYYAFAPLSHATTFLVLAAFLYLWLEARYSARTSAWFIMGLAGGFLAISRWQEVLFLAVPVLSDLADRRTWRLDRPWLRLRLAYAAGAALVAIPQLLEWKAIYGKYFTFPQDRHQPGFFQFPPQHWLEVMISSRNGWFVWTPLVLLGICGLIYGCVLLLRVYLPLLAVVGAEIVVIGAAHLTWSGLDSFSSRYLASSSVLIGIGVMLLLLNGGRMRRTLLLGVMAVCCIWTALFAVQMRLDLTTRDSYLTTSELLWDKFNLRSVYNRKAAARQAEALVAAGHPAEAIAVLDRIKGGELDRFLLRAKRDAYRAAGRAADVVTVEQQLQRQTAAMLP